MTHNDLKHISEWEYLERVDGLMMRQEDERDRNEDLVDFIADFFSQLLVINTIGKVKANKIPNVEEVKSGMFMTSREREQKAIEAYEKAQRKGQDKQQDVEQEKAKLLQTFGIKQ